ncbi:glycoside hydrolase family 3 C-terminal domain-containing protein [Pseudonocardia sp. CA-107938]|uniref:glycoside hydrolase family 3 C-terminal domain-containing protein n=1 Tax=Pseudonocardia sp. CA-107938 TaxID=3240021 RepID=UPI003D8BAB14
MTVEDAARFTAGATYWTTHPIPGHGPIRFADGPHGLRVQDDDPDHLGLGRSEPSTCFPPAVTLASSWDPELIRRVGSALATEARAKGVHVVLGPGMNLKRTPLCGRNFEYLSEDPLLSGLLAAAMVEGIQSVGVGACVKHFAANNQETERLRISADIDERPLHEIYLRGFELAIRQARPWAVMTAYNRINGVPASENPWLLTDVLRDQWGFDGVVVSDWGAVRDPAAAVRAGLDVRMPGPDTGRNDGRDLEPSVLDRVLERLTLLAQRTNGAAAAAPDLDEHHALTRRAAAESAVLLTNDGLLPLSPSSRIAFVGEMARTPRYQGAGSSRVNPTRVVCALDAATGRIADLRFAPGYRLDGTADGALLADAVEAASEADVVVLFLGLPDSAEAEGRDRSDIDLPDDQVALLRAVARANPRTVVALSNGSVVTTAPWRASAAAIVEFWLTGQAHGESVVDVLLGDVTPSGKLAETVPLRLADTPAYLDFPGERCHVRYGEGIHVGYRHYDARRLDVDFPFGHGLSYTEFAYTDLDVDVHDLADPVAVTLTLTLTNTGDRPGAEVVQVYVGDRSGLVRTPVQELRAFTKVRLAPGERRRVRVPVRRDHLQHYVPDLGWVFPGGPIDVHVGSSSRDIRLRTAVTVPGEPVVPPLTLWSTLADWSDHPDVGLALWKLVQDRGGMPGRVGDLLGDETGRHSVLAWPLVALLQFPGVPLTEADAIDLLSAAETARSAP